MERTTMRTRFPRLASRIPPLCAAVLAVILLTATSQVLAQAERIGTVVAVQSEVFAEREGSRRLLTSGAAVSAADRIVTGDQAKVEIAFLDGSTVAAGPRTQFSIADYDPTGRRSGMLSLIEGIIRVNLTAIWDGNFEVHTRAAVASVRSTHWLSIAEPARSSVFVLSGEVAVRATATGEEVVLAKGDGIDVAVGEGLAAVRRWPMERIGPLIARTFLP
jgi:hypothetical protein